MAFNRATSANIGTTIASVYTVPTGKTATMIGFSIANTTLNDITVSAQLNTTFLIKNATVPVGTSLIVVGGDQKVVLLANDAVKVTSSAAASADAVVSILEQ